MRRRDFLKRLGFGTAIAAAAAIGAFDVEKLLWVPGEKKIFVPPVNGWPTTAGQLGPIDGPIDGLRSLPGDAYLGHNGFIDIQWMTREVAEELDRTLARQRMADQWRSGAMSEVVGFNCYTNTDVLVEHGEYDAVIRKREIRGERVQVSVMFNATDEQRHANYARDWPAKEKFLREAYVKPAARQLAERITQDGMTRFGRLELPHHVEAASCCAIGDAPPVRGVKAYDIVQNMFVMRFDVLGAKA